MRRFALGERDSEGLVLENAPEEFEDAARAFNRMALIITEAEARQLTYTTDLDEIAEAQLYIVTVPTPIDAHKQPDLTPLRKASETVGSVLKKGDMSRVFVHMIADDALMNELSVATKLIPTPYTLARLKEAGQKAADTFLSTHKEDLNRRSSVDLVDMFQ